MACEISELLDIGAKVGAVFFGVVFCGGTKELTVDCFNLGSGGSGVAASSIGSFFIEVSNEGSSRMLPAPKLDLIFGGRKSAVESFGAGGFGLLKSRL